ncbi:bifunctional hydroxymethylpyrimidine kinase/phosphomethylpyrimidine kinase [Clostridium sp. BJN0001]|uniref:bifunctional hydroxymethylpyrimidine kinase/phosphomethylpyrimidine kinase n=1 Tax=Clostridium sp. BJN0001 TaxID=2930219 RepID=UPI001FD2106E|nr:bifunctional hydroxymethylpyrimidine kinase/phosphomethylpyrimidine kinase [Clostridium sp. BJN0001]
MLRALTIAGSDSSGGAGIQADLKTFSANGVFAMSAITAITAQNTMGVKSIEDISPEMIKMQIKAVFDDIRVDAVKIGMVSKKESIEAITETLLSIKNLPPVVLDPVMISKNGFNLLSKDAEDILVKKLFPLAYLITPNIPEAEEILKIKISNVSQMKEAAKRLINFGPKAVLVKGGHLDGEAIDILYDGNEFSVFKQDRIHTKNTHGTGCTLSSAIASNLAKGMSISDAVKEAKRYITIAIKHSINLGHGVGPTNHFYELYKKAGIEIFDK